MKMQQDMIAPPTDTRCAGLFESISPLEEVAAYEAMWDQKLASYKSIAESLSNHPDYIISDLVSRSTRDEYRNLVQSIWAKKSLGHVNIKVRGAYTYPAGLKDARYPVQLIYFQGDWSLIEAPSIAVVGAREASDEGIRRAKRLAKLLVKNNFTVVSGLARGIDTAAHEAAIEAGGNTVAVIGTPLSEYYPKENKDLQNAIRGSHLLISSVPFVRYSKHSPQTNRLFFPERNKLMSALTLGTVIVEASDTSGSLIQARAALEQGRKLFIMQSCFENKAITWPARLEREGGIRVREFDDVLAELKGAVDATPNTN